MSFQDTPLTPPSPPPGRLMREGQMVHSPVDVLAVLYVYDDQEVVKTGRRAVKQLPSGKVDTLYEIEPKSTLVNKWKKWVRDTDLYLVQGVK